MRCLFSCLRCSAIHVWLQGLPNARQYGLMNDALPTPQAHAQVATAAMARKPSAARLRKIDMILGSAERHFALLGFEGAPLEQIAPQASVGAEQEVEGPSQASYVASTLSASLELVKEGALEARQLEAFADLYLRARRGEPAL